MDIDWYEAHCEEFTAALTSGECRHVGFMVGSFASCGQPSSCLSVGDIRRETIAAILRATSDSPHGHGARKLLGQIHQDLADGSGTRWHDVLSNLPFEQFMACVAHGSSESAMRIAQLLCGSGLPNANHDAIAKTASRILDLRLADQVTIVTTNYDMCLDDALRKTLGDPTELPHQPATPLLPLREYSTEHGCVRYLKIHGCLSRPETLVFSFGQILRLLTSHDWEEAILDQLGGTDQMPSLALTVGYGFWDRDLDSFLSRWLQNARVFRNDPYLASDQPRTPTQFLQSEFFEHLRNRQHQEQADERDTRPWCVLRTPLLRDTESQDSPTPSVLQQCCLALELPRVDLPLARSTTDDQRCFDEALADDWSLEATGQFLGRLCHSAERKEGRRAMHALLGSFEVASTRVNVAHEYLRAIGVRDARKRGLICARMLRRRRLWVLNGSQSGRKATHRLPRDVRAIAWAYESFMVSLMIGQAGSSRFKKALFGLSALIADRRGWLNGLGQHHTQSIRAEYTTHFWVKAAQQLPVPGLRRVLVGSMRKRVGDLADGDDLDQYGDATALLAELLIHGQDGDGVRWATRARRLRAIIGRYSNAAQGDRLLGWGYLSQGERHKAVASFGQGLLLVLNGEPGVERKLGANLVRVPWAEAHRWLRELEPAELQRDEVQDAIHHIVAHAHAAARDHAAFGVSVEQCAEDWKTVFRHVLRAFYPNSASLIAELDARQDTSREWLYYPHCEPEG